MERWAPVIGYEGFYEVSDCGRVRSVSHITEHNRKRIGKLLQIIKTPQGYPVVNLSRLGRKSQKRVQRLVLEAFVGPCPPKMLARHYPDFTRTNCRLDNLSWASHSQNAIDRPSTKLSNHQCRQIIARRSNGASLLSLSRDFRVSISTVSMIARRLVRTSCDAERQSLR